MEPQQHRGPSPSRRAGHSFAVQDHSKVRSQRSRPPDGAPRKLISAGSLRVVRLGGSEYTDAAEPEDSQHANLVQLDRSEYAELH